VLFVIIAKKKRAKEEKRERRKRSGKRLLVNSHIIVHRYQKREKRDKVIRRHELTLLSLSF
jgi:hypothetical protein